MWPYLLGSDVVNAVLTWTMPLFVVIGNFCFANFGFLNTLVAVAHLLGDPIHAIENLLRKIDTAHYFNRLCQLYFDEENGEEEKEKENENGQQTGKGNVGWIFSFWEGVCRFYRSLYRSFGFGRKGGRLYQKLAVILWSLDDYGNRDYSGPLFQSLQGNKASRKSIIQACEEAADELSDNRMSLADRAILAILQYLAAVSVAYIRTFGGITHTKPLSNHLSHTIAFRELYY